ncbi:hypothetical protein G9P44_001052 [Scheffersomyces stipitis]|nr:hypothetical protein G9P44_001052 [Scheffersomyces stipitis]
MKKPNYVVLTKDAIQSWTKNANASSASIGIWSHSRRPSSYGETDFLHANYEFKTFKDTWKFLNKVADGANSLKHHPTITTTYNKVEFLLTTHDVGHRVTNMDIELAEAIRKEFHPFDKEVDKPAFEK